MSFEASDLSDARSMLAAIERDLPGLVVTEGDGDFFVFYDPDGVTKPDQRFPFCTVLTGDRYYDAASRLSRDPASYRVSLGVSRETYEAHFGPAPRQPVGQEVIDSGFDYATTDTLLPHPFYASMHWVCVVNPGDKTRADLDACLADAHAIARRTYDNQQKRRTSS